MIDIEIITPERVVYKSEGEEVNIPTPNGFLGIRSGHLPLVTPLKPGEVVISHNGKKEYFAVAGGFAEVLANQVKILADSAEHADEIDEMLVQEAIERAHKLKAEATDSAQFAEATSLIEMNLARQRVAKYKKGHGSHSHLNNDL